MRLLFVGDLFLGGDAQKNEIRQMIHSKVFWSADMKIANLEHPISNHALCADKCTLFTDSSAMNNLKQMSISAVCVANNHIHDKLDQGILDTLAELDNAHIGHFGAGIDDPHARMPWDINDEICILGYCDFGHSYLNKVQVASHNKPGVNPLRLESILRDLDYLEDGKKAILFFHWGREHVWLPPIEDIYLAKRLLEDDRVLMIIGSHSHRIQGYIQHNGKYAFMSLGNFLFPNFFMCPPTQITYPNTEETSYPITREYHPVFALTYKRWPAVCRASIMVDYDTERSTISIHPVYQRDASPTIIDLEGLRRLVIMFWVFFLSGVYKLPRPIYATIALVHHKTSIYWRYTKIAFFYLRSLGLLKTPKYVIGLLYYHRKRQNADNPEK